MRTGGAAELKPEPIAMMAAAASNDFMVLSLVDSSGGALDGKRLRMGRLPGLGIIRGAGLPACGETSTPQHAPAQ